MAGSSNILQWNPTAANQESDGSYATDSQRTGGAPVDAPFPSPTANKLFYQITTFVAALAQALAIKGYVISDANIATLTAVLANVITTVDLSTYAPLNSPLFTGNPRGPTPAQGDNSISLATTAFLFNMLAGGSSGFQINKSVNGFIKLPAILGGLIVQWGQGGQQTGGAEGTHVITFPTPFPTACLRAVVGTNISFPTPTADAVYQIVGDPSRTGMTVQFQNTGGSIDNSLTLGADFVAIGY